MKVVILAGGLGTRLSEETDVRPKPMVEIGGKPILWHIMKIYSSYGFNDFLVCLGYKGYVIKEYFLNYFFHHSDVTVELRQNTVQVHDSTADDWRVSLIDTGLTTQTGGRIKRIQKYIGNETCMLTYGDGVSNVNIPKLLEFHRSHRKYVTLTAVLPPGKYGALELDSQHHVQSFEEKPRGDHGKYINGGFFVLEPQVFDYITGGDDAIWEREPLARLAKDAQMAAFVHEGFWQCMDTLKDKRELEAMWASQSAPWALWSSLKNNNGKSNSIRRSPIHLGSVLGAK